MAFDVKARYMRVGVQKSQIICVLKNEKERDKKKKRRKKKAVPFFGKVKRKVKGEEEQRVCLTGRRGGQRSHELTCSKKHTQE